jgi:hypothetical protein
MTTACESITDRLLSTFPSGQYCLSALMRILEIVESAHVPTACVQCTARPRMFINPEFVAARAETPEKLLMLVMHELHHVILGHTRLYRRVEPIDNLVFDAVINAMLCRLFPDPEHTAMFSDYYGEDKFPECFLRPPPAWHPEQREQVVPVALQAEHRADLAALHRELYAGNGATYQELREAFESSGEDARIELARLLGDHREEGRGSSSDGLLENRAPVLLEEMRRITEQWPRPPIPIIGRSMHELLEGTIKTVPRSNRSRLEQILRKVGGAGGTGRIPQIDQIVASVSSAVPHADRRSVVITALGGRTLLYRGEVPLRRVTLHGLKVHVYLDVSGSIGNLVGPLYAAILACRDLVHPVIHLFSTKIADVTLDELCRGVCRSTGGTSIECVADHMGRHKVRRAVIVTDGYVGRPGASASAVLSDAVVGVAITPGNSTRADLESVTDHWINLTEIKP